MINLLLFLLIPTISLDANGSFRVSGWPEAASSSPAQWEQILTVSIDVPDVPPLLGSYRIEQDALVFVPQFPIQPGLRYRAVLRIPNSEPVTEVFDIPKRDVTPTTFVEQVYPSTSVLPENQLKFYIHFSDSMSRGEAYQRIHLLEEGGKPVEFPFLELPEELWDGEYKRLTIFFDPGRVKTGLVPNQELGLAIREGNTYTLLIDSVWQDANGTPLKDSFRKNFSVGPADHQPLNAGSWRLLSPKAGTSEPFVVEFPEPLDHALMQREFTVLDAGGNRVTGAIQIDRDETRWLFVPNTPWRGGSYSLRVGTVIADLAGNMLDRPFEVDVFERVDTRVAQEMRNIPFNVN
jgi:hypothetical protein